MKTQNYRVQWAHQTDGNPNEQQAKKIATQCNISLKNEDAPVAIGTAVVGRKDSFDRRLGCAISLHKCLSTIENRDVRKEVIEAYKATSPKSFKVYADYVKSVKKIKKLVQ